MNIKKTIIFSSLMVGFTISAFAQIVNQNMDMKINFQQCAQYQQLSYFKKANVDQIVTEYQKSVTPLQEQLHSMRMILNMQLSKSVIDEGVVNNLVNRISSLHRQIFADYVQMRIQLMKSAGFNPGACLKSTSKEPCAGETCQQPITQIVAPKAGFQTNAQQGLQPASSAGLQTAPQSGTLAAAPSSP